MIYAGLLLYLVVLYIRPGDWVPAVMGWRLELFAIALTLGGGLLRFLSTMDRRANRQIPIQFPLLLIWLCVVYLSNATAGDFTSAWDYTAPFAKRTIIFVMFWLALDEAWKVRGALLMIVALTAVLGLQGIYQVTHGVGWAGQEMYWGGRIKWVGLWDGANVLSLLFVTAIPTVMELVFGHAALVARLFALASGVLIFEGLYYAASRGAWLALAVVVLAYFRKRLGRAGLLVGSAFVAVLFVIGPSRLATIAGVEEGSADQKSAEHRIDMWAAGIDMVKEHPLLGVGKGKFRRYSMSLIAHNSFVQNMGETGLIGLFFWLAPVYFSIKGLRYVLAAGDASGPLHHSTARTVFVSLVGYLAVGTFITADFEPFFILMALSACMVAITRGPDGRPLRIPVTWRDGACILAIQAAGVIAVHLAVRLNSA